MHLQIKHQFSNTETNTIVVSSGIVTTTKTLVRRPGPPERYRDTNDSQYYWTYNRYVNGVDIDYDSSGLGRPFDTPMWHNTITRGKYSGQIYLPLDSKDLLIPLPVDIVDSMTYMERTALLGASVYFLFFAAQLDKITYYEGTMFGIILSAIVIVISIVVSVFCPPAGVAMGTAAASAAAVTAIVEKLLIGLILVLVLKIIAPMIKDSALRMIVTVVAMVAAAYAGGTFDNLSFDFSTVVELSQIPFKAMEVFFGAEMEHKMAGLSDSMQQLQQQSEAFMETYKSRATELSSLLQSMNTQILTTENLVNLNQNYDTISSSNDARGTVLSASTMRYLLIDSYKDYDTLYVNPIEVFFNSQNKLGMIDI